MRKRVIILGAAGRDFHNFNVFFRDKPEYEVVCFTATQIPGIAKRRYPRKLAGRHYPRGIRIFPEEKLPQLIKRFKADVCVFSYSDVSHENVMHLASLCIANGCDFWLLGPDSTTLKSHKKVVAVTAVRTGAGKSPLTRRIVDELVKAKKRVAVVRHPMPYGDLEKQIAQRFVSHDDLDRHQCTAEEREEYEPLIDKGVTVFAGVDYAQILRMAEKEADVVIWDGGNNDLPFFVPDVHFCVADALRPGHEIKYHPGEANFRRADVIVINKMNVAKEDAPNKILKNVELLNPHAIVVKVNSVVSAHGANRIKGKHVLCVEDGPTLTHGGLTTGAAMVLAKKYGAHIVTPERVAVGSIKEIFRKFPHLANVLPAMGYGKQQMKELEQTINRVKADFVLIGTPFNLARELKLNKPPIKVHYELREIGKPGIRDALRKFGIV